MISSFFKESEFFTYILVAMIIYIAQTFFKISAVRKSKTFDWRELFDGLIDHIIYFAGVIVFFFAGSLIPDIKLLEVNGQVYSIPDALTLIALALIGIQSAKCFRNIRERWEIDDDVVQKYIQYDAQSERGIG